MSAFDPLFGNISKIYMATAQSKIFWLRRISHLATAHLPIIYLLQIDQLLPQWKSSKYLITLHWKILWQLHIAYLETFRRFIWLLRKAQFLGYWASMILLLRITQLFMNCKSTNYFTTGNRLHNWLLCIENFMTNSNHLFGNISNIYKATAQRPSFWLLRITQLF
jgi:hypothetical protein